MGVYLEREMEREILSANYITFVNPALHPDRVLNEHDFLYMLDGSWRKLFFPSAPTICSSFRRADTTMEPGCAPPTTGTCIFM